jgi:DNA-binding transcriptional LysR family regulator
VGALEALVGQRLVERSRGRRTVELTDAGRLLLGHAEAIESRLRAAEADFRAYAAGVSGGLRIGIYQSVATKVLPEVLRRFATRWPEVEVQATEETNDIALVEAVERGALDLSFAIAPIPDGPFAVRELMRDANVLVVAAGAASAWRRPHVRDLDGTPMVAFQLGRHQVLAEEFLAGLGVRPRVVFRSNDNGTLQAMVAAGLGVALSPLLAVDENDPRVRVLPLVEPVPDRVLLVVWHRDRYRPPAAAAFVDTAVTVAAEVQRVHDAFIARVSAKVSRSRRRRIGSRASSSARPALEGR